MQKIFTAFLFFSLAHAATAQQKSPSIQEMEKQMQQLMEELRKGFSGGSFFNMPGGDSSYTFRFDTTITGDNFFGSFQFGPFGGDSTMRNDPFGSDFFQQFRNDMDNFWRGFSPEETPEEDQSGEEPLLPEERLRLEEEKERSGKEPSDKTKPSEPAKPKIKTIRI